MKKKSVACLLAAATFSAVRAGSLEPPGPVSPTMKALSDVPSAWKSVITAVSRFELVMNAEAVLDHETGLVWEQAPVEAALSWSAAVDTCFRKTLGSRRGWRLPAVEELASLATPGFAAPALPDGHPFAVSSDTFWTITTQPDDNRRAYGVFLLDGSVLVGQKSTDRAIAWGAYGAVGGPIPCPGP